MAVPNDKKKWFILIGVDFYMRGDTRHDQDGRPLEYPNLEGCVRDISLLYRFILGTLKVDRSQILKLTATPNGKDSNEPKEDATQGPTCENIIRLMKTVTASAEPGDIVHIHYSGHGGQVKTKYPELKGPNGYDEAIVPYDINCGGIYLRDVEVAELLEEMVKKKLVVTVVLDSCHSGSAVRGPGSRGPVSRGIGKVDYSVLPESDIPWNLSAIIRSSYRDAGRLPQEGWLLESKGYELLAACRLNEMAYEITDHDEDGHRHGALTHFLLKALKSSDANLTHSTLHRKILADIQNHHFQEPFDYLQQTPIFAGNGKRIFFGSGEGHHASNITVQAVKAWDNIILGVGAAQGISIGWEYVLYPWDASDFSVTRSSPTISITEVRDFESQGKLSDGHFEGITPGWQAVPAKTPVRKLPVKFVQGHSNNDQWEKLRKVLCSDVFDSPIEVIPDNDQRGTEFQIGMDDDDRFILCDTSNKPVPTFPSSKCPKLLLHRLTLWPNMKCFYSPGTPFTVKDGGAVYTRFKNLTSEPVNLTIFDFQPLQGITQIYPLNSDFETVLPGDERRPGFMLTIPEQLSSMTTVFDVLKAFVTIRATSFRSLEQPDIEPDAARGSTHYQHYDELEQLLNTLDVPHRGSAPPKSTIGAWATSEITISITRN
ncbi:caspase domain-containing protein [Trichophaea hybrida]|nr:caspase domain-containing protein [Trichophaea hybrida]